MKLIRATSVAAVATAAFWTAKAVAIGLAGGPGKSPVEGPLFLLGLLTVVVGSVLLGAAVWRSDRPRPRVTGVLAALAPAVVGALAQTTVVAVRPAHPGWVWGEVNLWATALTLLGLVLVLLPAAGSGRQAAQRQRRPSMNLR